MIKSKNIIEIIKKKIIYKYNSIIRYGIYSIIVTIIDIYIVHLIVKNFSVTIVIANSIGVLFGSFTHYILSIKNIFSMESNRNALLIYFGTCMLGLAFADYIIWLFYTIFKAGLMISKGLSIVVPFFFIYSIRKSIFSYLQKEKT